MCARSADFHGYILRRRSNLPMVGDLKSLSEAKSARNGEKCLQYRIDTWNAGRRIFSGSLASRSGLSFKNSLERYRGITSFPTSLPRAFSRSREKIESKLQLCLPKFQTDFVFRTFWNSETSSYFENKEVHTTLRSVASDYLKWSLPDDFLLDL